MPIVFKEEITNAGLSLSYDPQSWGGTDALLCLYTTSPVTLGGNIGISITTDFNVGCGLTIIQSASIDRNGRTLNVVPPTGGLTYNTEWQFITPSVIYMKNIDGTNYSFATVWNVLSYGTSGGGMDATEAILDASIGLSKLAGGTPAQTIVVDSSNNPQYVTETGDVTKNSSGVNTIANNAITNAKVSSSAAIARSKLASGTASQVLINDGSGVMTSEAQLAATRGGTGHDFSSSTGFQTWSAGTASVGAITFDRDLLVSFETGLVGDFKIKWDFDGECTGIYGFLTKAIGAADATVTPKNQSGTTLTGGVLTFTASDPKGTAETSVPSANNTFSAGDIWTFTTAGGSAAGYCQLSISYTRTS